MTYYFYSRTLLPLFAAYVAGQAIGRAMYVATGHLGLFGGPLGELKQAFLSGAGRRPMVDSQDVLAWFPAVLFAYLLVVELGRQAKRRQDPRGALFLLGVALTLLTFTIPTIGRHMGWRVDDSLVSLGAVGAGAALVASRWRRWRGRDRVLAVAAACVGVVLGVVLFRLSDTVHLGRAR